MPKDAHCWLGQAKPSVFTRLGAPRRLFTSRQGRTGAEAGSRPGEARRQAGQSSGVRGDAADGGWRNGWYLLLRRKSGEGASQDAKAVPERGGRRRIRTTTQERPYESSLFERCGRNSFPIIRRVGRTCQVRGRKVRIIHYQVGQYPPSVQLLDMVDNSISHCERISGSFSPMRQFR